MIDDEDLLRRATAQMLERAGHTVLTAVDGAEGLACFEENADRIDVVILDHMMPVLNGDQVLSRLQNRRADVRVLMVSGFIEGQDARIPESGDQVRFLRKPYSRRELLDALSRLSN